MNIIVKNYVKSINILKIVKLRISECLKFFNVPCLFDYINRNHNHKIMIVMILVIILILMSMVIFH